jgi:exonuclease III
VLSSLTEMFRNKESIIKAFNEIKNWLKNTDTPERVVYISLTLVALVIAWLWITMLDEQTNHLIVKMLWALRFVNWVKGAGKSVKEAIIAGGKNEARNIANSHTYDNTNHKDLFGNKRDRLNNIVSE